MKNSIAIDKYSNSIEDQPNSKPSGKLTGADGLRAIACLSVITHHISQQIMMNVQPLWIQKLQAFALIGNTGVSIFFILSGFLLSYPFWKNYLSNRDFPNIKEYSLRRAARIMPGFYLALMTSSLIVIIYNIPVENLWIRLVAGLTFISGFNYVTFFPTDINGALWSISFEVFCYFLMPIFINQLVHILFTPNNILRGWQYGIIGGAKAWMPNYNQIGFFGQFSFGIIAAGITVVLYRDSEKILNLKRRYLFDIIGLVSLTSSFALLWFMKDKPEFGFSLQSQPYFFPFYQLLIATTLAVLPHTNFIGKILDNRFFRYTANISFGLYLWHHLYIYIVSNLLIKKYSFMNMASLKDWFIISAGIIIFAYFTATLSYKFIEMPIVNLVHKKKFKRKKYNNTMGGKLNAKK